MDKDFCCDSMKAMVEKGYVKLDIFPNEEGADKRFFSFDTDVPHETGGLVSIILLRCFVCGQQIYPLSLKGD